MKDHKIRVAFTINELSEGGAEQQLLELVNGIDKTLFEPFIVPLYPGGFLESEFKKIPGAHVVALHRKGKYDLLYSFRLVKFLRHMQVDVIQPYLTPSAFFTLVSAILSRTPVKIVTERSAQFNGGLGYSLYLKVEDLLSRFADYVVSNSEAGREFVRQRGIPRYQTKVIYNGINLARLVPDEARINEVRRQLGISPHDKVVGIMGSLSEVKDHATFLRAAAIISRNAPNAKFAILGDGPLKAELQDLSRELGIASKTMFLGQQRDVATYLSIFDVAVLTSQTEGCSNSLLEAMALGKPVVATDVGGNRELVHRGDNGFLVLFGDAEAVAYAVLSVINDPETARVFGQKAQEIVMNQFSLKRMVGQYQNLYTETLNRKRNKRRPQRDHQGTAS